MNSGNSVGRGSRMGQASDNRVNISKLDTTSVSASAWADLLQFLRTNHSELVRGWFRQLEPISISHGVIEIHANTESQRSYLSDHCQRAFTEAAQAVFGTLLTVEFRVAIGVPERARAPLTASDVLHLNPDYTFEEFVTGPCNRLAHAACVAVAENPGQTYNPLFIHGNVGLGKTHLLQAICHRVFGSDTARSILYLTGEDFTNDFLEAVSQGRMNEFRHRYRHVDALVIDDIQFLAERERSQEEFFHTFNALRQVEKQIILSADCPPKDLQSLQDRLVSRFTWGLVVRIDDPCLETRMAILERKAHRRGMDLPRDVQHYIASRIQRNTRELEGALNKLDAVSHTTNGKITLDLARLALQDEIELPHNRVTVDDVINIVTSHYGVKLSDLQGRRRNQGITRPRQICMYLIRHLSRLTLEEIGGYFGGRDHTTVMHALQVIENARTTDHQLDRELDELANLLGGSNGRHRGDPESSTDAP